MADRRRRRRTSSNSESEHSEGEDISELKTYPAVRKNDSQKLSECESEVTQGETSEYDSTTEGYDEETETEEEDDDDVTEDADDDEDDVIIQEGEWVDGERQLGDGEEQPADGKDLDDDEDKKNPAYIPRRGAFYEHDTRLGEEAKEEPEQPQPAQKKKLWSDAGKWDHNKYNPDAQAPKSREEIIAFYGYDIRSRDKPPDAPLRGTNRGRRPDRNRKLGDYMPGDGRRYHDDGGNYGYNDSYRGRGERGRGQGNYRGRGPARPNDYQNQDGQRSYTDFKNNCINNQESSIENSERQLRSPETQQSIMKVEEPRSNPPDVIPTGHVLSDDPDQVRTRTRQSNANRGHPAPIQNRESRIKGPRTRIQDRPSADVEHLSSNVQGMHIHEHSGREHGKNAEARGGSKEQFRDNRREPPQEGSNGRPGGQDARRGPQTGSQDIRGPHPGSQNIRGPPPGSQDIRGPPPGSQNIRGPLPGNQDIRGPHLGSQNVRGPHPGSQNVRGPHPGSQNVRGPPPGSQDVRGPPPGSQDFRGPHPGSQDNRGPHPGSQDNRSPHLGSQNLRGPLPGSQNLRGPPPGSQDVRSNRSRNQTSGNESRGRLQSNQPVSQDVRLMSIYPPVTTHSQTSTTSSLARPSHDPMTSTIPPVTRSHKLQPGPQSKVIDSAQSHSKVTDNTRTKRYSTQRQRPLQDMPGYMPEVTSKGPHPIISQQSIVSSQQMGPPMTSQGSGPIPLRGPVPQFYGQLFPGAAVFRSQNPVGNQSPPHTVAFPRATIMQPTIQNVPFSMPVTSNVQSPPQLPIRPETTLSTADMNNSVIVPSGQQLHQSMLQGPFVHAPVISYGPPSVPQPTQALPSHFQMTGHVPPMPFPNAPPPPPQPGQGPEPIQIRGGTTYFSHEAQSFHPGTTYFAPQAQQSGPVMLSAVSRRPKAAIPIVNPQDIGVSDELYEQGIYYPNEVYEQGDDGVEYITENDAEYTESGTEFKPDAPEFTPGRSYLYPDSHEGAGDNVQPGKKLEYIPSMEFIPSSMKQGENSNNEQETTSEINRSLPVAQEFQEVEISEEQVPIFNPDESIVDDEQELSTLEGASMDDTESCEYHESDGCVSVEGEFHESQNTENDSLGQIGEIELVDEEQTECDLPDMVVASNQGTDKMVTEIKLVYTEGKDT